MDIHYVTDQFVCNLILKHDRVCEVHETLISYTNVEYINMFI